MKTQINNLAKAITALERAQMEKIQANARVQKTEAVLAAVTLFFALLWVLAW